VEIPMNSEINKKLSEKKQLKNIYKYFAQNQINTTDPFGDI
jgi:hypothetical protein